MCSDKYLKQRSAFNTFSLFLDHVVVHSNGAIPKAVLLSGRKKLRTLLGHKNTKEKKA